MAQDSSKQGFFSSIFGSKKKSEEQLEAEQELRKKIEDRIREVLIVTEEPKPDHA